MRKLLVPMALALALTASGAAIAGSIDQTDSYGNALYGRPNPFDAVQATPDRSQWTAASDARLSNESQQANTARMERQQPASSEPDPWADNGVFGRYGPE